MKLRSFIQKTISNFLTEANVERDYEFYKIADEFYEKMIKELEIGNYIIQPKGIIFKASEVNPQYHNLFILFVDKSSKSTLAPFLDSHSSAGYAFGKSKQHRVIVINNLDENKQPERGIRKDGFIHEFIHFLDFKRSRYTPKITKDFSEKEYYNLPTEYNAYYQEAASMIVKWFQDDSLMERFKEKFKTFDSFYKWMIDSVFDKDFIKNLNDTNLIKLQKRVYGIYDKYFN